MKEAQDNPWGSIHIAKRNGWKGDCEGDGVMADRRRKAGEEDARDGQGNQVVKSAGSGCKDL